MVAAKAEKVTYQCYPKSIHKDVFKKAGGKYETQKVEMRNIKT